MKDLSVKFIDFERMHVSLNPKNTRQFLEYLKRNSPRLIEKGIIIDSGKILHVGIELKSHRRRVYLGELV